jgi:tRNA threonylcarbamoyladenosine dehydratase
MCSSLLMVSYMFSFLPRVAFPAHRFDPWPPRHLSVSTSASASNTNTSTIASKPISPHTHWGQRSELLVGRSGMETLAVQHVLVVGLGGVGGQVAESLVRAGVGHLTILDGDAVDLTNINRQVIATTSTVGLRKTDVMATRLLDINPSLNLRVLDTFLMPEGDAGPEELLDRFHFTHVVDCIDAVAPKVALLAVAHRRGVPVVSALGAGGRLDPTAIHIGELMHTQGDRLAKVVRHKLRKDYNIQDGIICVYSTERLRKGQFMDVRGQFKRSSYGTTSYVPAVFGLVVASVVIRTALGEEIQFSPGLNRTLTKKEAKKERRKRKNKQGSGDGVDSTVAKNANPTNSERGVLVEKHDHRPSTVRSIPVATTVGCMIPG